MATSVVLDLASQPRIERQDFEELVEQGVFGAWLEQARAMREKGFCVLRIEGREFQETCRTLKAGLSRTLGQEIAAWHRGEAGPPRLQDGWLQDAAIRRLCLLPQVLELLTCLYGRRPIPFQSLNFAIGSQQPVHSDAVHFNSYPLGFMCGVWIALEDVQRDSGPLMYYPTSHLQGYLSAEDLRLSPDQVKAEQHPQRFFQEYWHQAIDQWNLEKELFHPQCGEILVWHANLLHGGEAVLNRGLSRWSQVNHYYFEDCLYTTPIQSFAEFQGGPTLRNPYNIHTRRRVFSESQWRNLGIQQPADRSASSPGSESATADYLP